ncbi:hypothetical protein O1L68_12635 [Streptomyces lydicus]|nr:hypothetical protein [Streptomyces lydicus]
MALGGELPHQAHLPALTQDTHADAALGELLACGLITPVGSHYRLAATVQEQLEAAGYAEGAAARAHTAAQHYAWWAGHPSVTPERVAAESAVALAAMGALTGSRESGHASAAVLLARTAAPAFAAALQWNAWERTLRHGQEAARLAGEVAEEAYFHHELGVLALCTGSLDRARAELEASIGLRGCSPTAVARWPDGGRWRWSPTVRGPMRPRRPPRRSRTRSPRPPRRHRTRRRSGSPCRASAPRPPAAGGTCRGDRGHRHRPGRLGDRRHRGRRCRDRSGTKVGGKGALRVFGGRAATWWPRAPAHCWRPSSAPSSPSGRPVVTTRTTTRSAPSRPRTTATAATSRPSSPPRAPACRPPPRNLPARCPGAVAEPVAVRERPRHQWLAHRHRHRAHEPDERPDRADRAAHFAHRPADPYPYADRRAVHDYLADGFRRALAQ